MLLCVVYNKYTLEIEFTGTGEECQKFIADYGGGWAALDTRRATKEERESYES